MDDPRIKDFVEAARALASGDGPVQVPETGSDGLATLGRALNDLASSLQRRSDERSKLHDLYQDLLEAQRRLERANAELLRLAAFDSLTGISNRRAFDERLDMEWRRAVRDGTSVSVLLVDIDHFKRYNDSAGHLAGDECLRLVARALSRALRRAHDFIGRYGGEEFGVIIAGADEEAAARTAERLRRVVAEQRLEHPDSPVGTHVTVSVGGASEVPARDSTVHGLLETADDALYRAKAAGRNRVFVERVPALEVAAEGGGDDPGPVG